MKARSLFLTCLLCLFTAGTAFAQQQQQRRTIRGTVVDSLGQAPVANPTITIVGTDRGTVGAADGTFVLRDVPGDSIDLRMQRIGFRTRTVTVPPGQTEVTIRTVTKSVQLEEVVVTGRATRVEKKNLATAVTAIETEQVNEVSSATVEASLQGKIPGAIISDNSGAPGGGMQVRLRGVTSINAKRSQPLYVVDGIIISNDAIPSNLTAATQSTSRQEDDPVNRVADLNPEDIESVEVLKGPSAAAIYGSKASAGVIIIETKHGTEGEPRIDISQRFGYSDLSNTFGSRTFDTEEEAVAVFGDVASQYYEQGRTFDNEEALAGRNDLNHETSLSVAGGTEAGSYFFSGLWQNNEGIIANTGAEKQSVRANANTRKGKVNLTVSTNVVHNEAARGVANNDNSQTSYYMVLQGTPNFFDLRKNGDGQFPVNPFIGNGSNPLQTAALSDVNEDVWRGVGGLNLSVAAATGDVHSLRLTADAGVDAFQQENELFFPPALHFEDVDGQPGTSLLTKSDNVNFNTNVNAIHTYRPGGFELTTSVGTQFERQDLNIARTTSRNLTAGFPNIDAGTQIQVGERTEVVEDFGVYLQEELLAFDERLFLSASGRLDQSSSNGDPDDIFFYPNASASYRLTDLGGIFQEVKLRAAFGQTGNQPKFGQKFTDLSSSNIEGIAGVTVGNQAGDSNITPERSSEFEAGVDATMFSGRATFTATYYRQQITDLILERQLAPSSGFNTQFFQGGELRNQGIELSLDASPVAGETFTWNSNTTFSLNTSEVTELPVPAFRPTGFGASLGMPQVEEGEPVTQIVGTAGDTVVKIGNTSPDFQMGFSNNLTFGSLRMHSLVEYKQGGDIIHLTQLLYDISQNSPDFEVPEGEEPQPVTECHPDCYGQERVGSAFGGVEGFLDGFARGYTQSGTFVKLRELSLTWRMPESVRRGLSGVLPLPVESLSLTATGRNLLTFTPFEGLTPEVSNFGNQQVGRNIDVAPFPPSRTFWVGVDVGL